MHCNGNGLFKLFTICAISILFVNDVYVNGFLDQYYYTCYIQECCIPNSQSMPRDMIKFEEDIKQLLYGQHLAELVLLKNLKFHVLKENPDKALLLIFNGMSGTGKSYTAKLIVKSLFAKGFQSKYVHMFISGTDFMYEMEINEYKKKIQREIIEAVKLCPYSVFIFDEVHNLPGNTLDSISQFFNPYDIIEGVDMRKTIFILLSNSGGLKIQNIYIEALKYDRKRESIKLHEMEHILEENTFSMKNDGFRKSNLFSRNLVTAFVPFLPLEKSHVRSCIRYFIKNEGFEEKDNIVENVMDTLTFNNVNGSQLSESGCKRVADKTQLFL